MEDHMIEAAEAEPGQDQIQAFGAIEVTLQMVAVGLDVYAETNPEIDDPSDIVASIYRAMIQAKGQGLGGEIAAPNWQPIATSHGELMDAETDLNAPPDKRPVERWRWHAFTGQPVREWSLEPMPAKDRDHE